VGVPESLINALSKTKEKDFEVISNEGGVHHHGLDVMLETKQVV
jgi:acyl CoA:acetate/3-ketoacid CoA transferase alpha subunit